MLSNANRRILEYIRAMDECCMPDDQRPEWIESRRLESMCDSGLLTRITLVPPGREGYEYGLGGYMLAPDGIDALKELEELRQQIADLKADQEKQAKANDRQRRKDIRGSFFRDIVVMLIGIAAPHALDAVWTFLTVFFE